MKKKKCILFLLYLVMSMSFCVSFDYVYVDSKTLQRQLSYLHNGFISILLHIDPTRKDDSTNYSAPGKIIKERIFKQKTQTSSEIIQLILDITRKNQRAAEEGWYPTYKLYIKYTDRVLFFIPSEKYLGVIFDFKHSIIFIEGRTWALNKQQANLIQEKFNDLLKNPDQK